MSSLRDAITAVLGGELSFQTNQYPSRVSLCLVARERFADAARAMKKAYALLAAEWATDERPFGRGFAVFACYRWVNEYLIVKIELPADDPVFPSLTKKFVPAYRFERQIHSLLGVVPEGHPDLRPWIKFEDWPVDAFPLRKDFDGSKPLPRVAGEYRWSQVVGDGIYEIPVGPVHAGIIEPGHFRFHAVGEMVVNLEERLGYVHKGIEKRFESLSWQEGGRLAARISGDTTVAHSIAYSMAVEAMTKSSIPERAQWLRALFLERERIANHLGDIGAICNDVAFAFMIHQLSRLKEILLRTNMRLFGHRFIMDRVIPGGVTVDISEEGKKEILAELDQLSGEFERLVVIYEENSSLEDRAKETGILSPEKARDLCVVGIVARASGLNFDCRLHNPFPPYDRFEVKVPVLIEGDVNARVWVRIEEIRESLWIIRYILNNIPNIPEGPLSAGIGRPESDSSGFAAVEGWRGEIICWAQAGPKGEINRLMVRDPSSVSWIGLEQAILENIVPDFPVCNKSFNQSYSGHDL